MFPCEKQNSIIVVKKAKMYEVSSESMRMFVFQCEVIPKKHHRLILQIPLYRAHLEDSPHRRQRNIGPF